MLAVYVFDIAQAFLAPWAALLTVHATVYRTLRARRPAGRRERARRAARLRRRAACSGVNAAVARRGRSSSGLVAGAVRGLRAETTTAAATALVVLTTGYSDDGGMLVRGCSTPASASRSACS